MSEDKAMKYCYDYLDLVELIRYYDINTYEKIFGHNEKHAHLKLMIDRKVTKLISEELILENTELQTKLDKAVEALNDLYRVLPSVGMCYCDQSVGYTCNDCLKDKIMKEALKELGVD